MKYFITNPDSFGDVVLRQPLFTGLLNAGHEVAVLVKKSYSSIIHFIDPRLKMFMIDDLNPYVITVLEGKENVIAVLDEAAAFDPDVVVVAPYQRTLIDNWTLERFSDRQTIGMKGIEVDYEDGVRVFRPVSRRVKKLLHVPENLGEVEKNRRLLSLCLGKEVEEFQPKLTLPSASRTLAETTLKQLQLEKNDFILCAPGGASVPLKQYPAAQYSHILKHWGKTHQRKVLLVGNISEQATVDEISGSLRKSRVPVSTWIGNETELEILLGLISLSKVYFGNDSGPMHFAAALGKPVIAIFGGGHWPRFVPAAKTGAAILQDLPCFGCGWQCIFEKALCVHSIDERRIIDAIDSFEGGEMKQFKILSKSFEGEIPSVWIQEAREKLKFYKGQTEVTRVEREKDTKKFEQKTKELSDELQTSRTNLSTLQENMQTADKQAQQLLKNKEEELQRSHAQIQDQAQRLDKFSVQLVQEQEYHVRLQERVAVDEINAQSMKQQLHLQEEKYQLIAKQLEGQILSSAALSKRVEEEKQLRDSFTRDFEREKSLTVELSKHLEEEKQLRINYTRDLEREKNLTIELSKQLEEEKQLKRALANELDDGKRANVSLRKQSEEEKQLNIVLTNELEEGKRANVSLGKQLEEEKQLNGTLTRQVNEEKNLNLKLANQVKAGEEKVRVLQMQLTEQTDQLKKEREEHGQLQSRAKVAEENSRILQSQLNVRGEQLRTLTQMLDTERKTTVYLKDKVQTMDQEVTEMTKQLQQQGRSIKEAAGNLRDLKPKLEELHLSVRMEEEYVQEVGEGLNGLMKSGWIRLGIRAGIPWLSRWHHQMFGANALDAQFPSSHEKFQTIISYKEFLRTRIDEITSSLNGK